MMEINYAIGTLTKASKSGNHFEKNVNDFPLSALTQFHLLYHYKSQNDPLTAAQLKKTAIQFPNPLWMRYQLEQALRHLEKEKSTISAGAPIDESSTSPIIDVVEESEKNEGEENESENVISENAEQPFLGEPKMFPKEDPVPEEVLAEAGAEAEAEAESNDELILEPLSMQDYFASQGITIPAELLENDKLGKQMKSFTAWLKEMKRLHGNQLPAQNPAIERMIRSSAEKSNSQQEILTETMADILIKQGRPEKAIELYEKLSLMNPSKSTYFAAKIDILKNP